MNSTECTPLAGTSWAATAQRVAAVCLLVFGSVGFGTVFVSGRRVIAPPRFVVANQAYLLVAFVEAVFISFVAAYLAHLLPCTWSECMRDRDATVSATLLVAVWPVGTVAIMAARIAGSQQFTLFRKTPTVEAAVDEPASIAGFFQFRDDL